MVAIDEERGLLVEELRKRQKELEESEERFPIIEETAADAIICMKSPGAVTLWNKSAERMFGYAADEVIGKNLHDIIVPERYREKSLEGLKGFFETGTGPVVGKTVELFALRRDGSEFPVELSISAMRIKDEWQTAAIVRDITERKQAEEGLEESEERFRTCIENMLDSFGIYSAVRDGSGSITDFLIEYVNSAACENNRMSLEEQVGRRLNELLPAHRKTGLFDEYCRVVETGKQLIKESFPFEDVYEGQPSARFFDINAVKLGDGFAASWRDVTERKRAEEKLRHERDRVTTYLNIAGVMFVVIDPNEKVVLVNKKATEVLGCPEGEIMGKNWFDEFLPERIRDEIKGVFRKLMNGENGHLAYVENPVLTRSGEERIIAWHNTILKDEAGKIIATLSSGEDITERRKAEEDLKKNLDDIKRMNKMMVDREIRMMELKKENQRLRDELGKKVNG